MSDVIKCVTACKMDVDICKTPDHPECIRCGACIKLVRKMPSIISLWENPVRKERATTGNYLFFAELLHII